MKRKSLCAAVIVSGAIAVPGVAVSATIESWNTANVEVPAADPPDGVTGFSIVYDGDAGDAGSQQTGRIAFTPPEAVRPGLQVDNGAYDLGGPGPERAAGCIRASSGTTCDGPFQSGKRFKQQITGDAPMDLVFDVDPNGVKDSTATPGIGYQVFHRVVNLTESMVNRFTVSLGFGVGTDFVASSLNDGLGFSTLIELGPNKESSFSQYPFGLFGDEDTNPNFTLGGFFDTENRSGFNLVQTEDTISSAGFYGMYDDLFGNWLSQEMTPDGALWDNDDNPDTDALVMAWYREDIGKWEIRREIDPNDPTAALALDTAVLVDDFAAVEDYLSLNLPQGTDLVLGMDLIEDLANLNLNYAIDISDGEVDFSEFTLRVEMTLAPVPLPATLSLFAAALAGLGAYGAARRRTLAQV